MTTYHRLAEQPIETDIVMCEGLFVKTAVFAAGTHIAQHSHATDHLSVVASGAVRAWRDDEMIGDFRAPAGIVIRARVRHMFLALEDHTTVLCIHRVDETGEPARHAEHTITFVENA